MGHTTADRPCGPVRRDSSHPTRAQTSRPSSRSVTSAAIGEAAGDHLYWDYDHHFRPAGYAFVADAHYAWAAATPAK